jgi:hypothetical protein
MAIWAQEPKILLTAVIRMPVYVINVESQWPVLPNGAYPANAAGEGYSHFGKGSS